MISIEKYQYLVSLLSGWCVVRGWECGVLGCEQGEEQRYVGLEDHVERGSGVSGWG